MTDNKQNKIIFVIAVLVLQLIFLYFVKYSNQRLSLSEFSFFQMGNVINFFIYLGIISGLVIVRNKKQGYPSRKTLSTFLIVSWLLIVLGFVSTRIAIIPQNSYLLSQPADKVIIGLLFLFFILSMIFFLSFLWATIFTNGKPTFLRNAFNSILILIVFFILIIIYIDNIGYTSGRWAIQKNQKNIAVVLGAAVWSGNIPSPTLSSRVDKALDLLEEGFVGNIVLTGGKAPGELAESEVGLAYAKSKGVNPDLITIESATSSTNDQIRWIKDNLSINNSYADIILISDAYHLPRVIEISKFYNLDIKVAESAHKNNFKDLLYNKFRESIALFNFWNFAL
jgi:vancomycin permeability regulator SanA